MMGTFYASCAALTMLLVFFSCKKSEPASQEKAVVGTSWFSWEELWVYRLMLKNTDDDPDLTLQDAECLYVYEQRSDVQITDESRFSSATSITEHRIDKKAFSNDLSSQFGRHFDAFNNTHWRTGVWCSLVKDYIAAEDKIRAMECAAEKSNDVGPAVKDIQARATAKVSMRILRKVLAVAKEHEMKEWDKCPKTHPRARVIPTKDHPRAPVRLRPLD
jgi:hypothetical protein